MKKNNARTSKGQARYQKKSDRLNKKTGRLVNKAKKIESGVFDSIKKKDKKGAIRGEVKKKKVLARAQKTYSRSKGYATLSKAPVRKSTKK